MFEPFRLGDHCSKIGSGATPRGGKDSYVKTGPFRLIRSQNVYNSGFSKDGLVCISEEQAAALSSVEVMPNDILLNITGNSVARSCQVDANILPARVNQHVAIIRPDPASIDPRFLRFFLISPNMQSLMLSYAGAGATRNALTKGMIENFKVPPIAIDLQRSIGLTLGALEDKIELNRQMNQTLEAMARAFFKDWFVDFGPTRAKMERRTPYLTPDLWSLFPARIDKETGLPEGWGYYTVGERFDVKIGRTPPRKEAWHFTDGSNGVPWLSIRDLGECGVYVNDTSEGLTEKSVVDRRVPVVEAGTVLVSFKLTVGRVSISNRAMATNEAIAHLNPRERNHSPYFTYCWMSGFDYSRLGSTSSIATAVNSQIIKKMPFPNINGEIEDQFAFLVEPLFQKIKGSTLESRALAQTRDLLLPKLMSGEIRLREAEQIAGEAL